MATTPPGDPLDRLGLTADECAAFVAAFWSAVETATLLAFARVQAEERQRIASWFRSPEDAACRRLWAAWQALLLGLLAGALLGVLTGPAVVRPLRTWWTSAHQFTQPTARPPQSAPRWGLNPAALSNPVQQPTTSSQPQPSPVPPAPDWPMLDGDETLP